MKLNRYIDLVLINIKSTKLSSLLFLIASVLVLFLGNVFININPNYNAYINIVFKENLDMRSMLVYKEGEDYETTINNTSEYQNVLFSYNQMYNYIDVDMNITNGTENKLAIKPVYDNFSPTIIKGRKIENKGEIVCPLYLSNVNAPQTKDDLVYMGKYLDDYVTITYSSLEYDDIKNPTINQKFEKKLKVVGLYNNTLSITSYNECYMQNDELIDMVKESKDVYTDNFLKDNEIIEDGVFTDVIVDDIDNFKQLKSKLMEDGYEVSDKVEIGVDFANKLKDFSYKGLIFVAILLLFILWLFISNIIKNNKNLLAMYKVFGFKEKDLVYVMILQITLLMMSAYILSLIVLIICVVVANFKISNYINYICLSISIFPLYEILYFIFIICFIIFTSYYITGKVSKLQIRRILDENN